MLIENLKPRVIYVGGRLLIPGMNKITDEDKKALEKKGYWSSLAELAEHEEIIFHDDEKVTLSNVKKTYDEDLLKSWLPEAKSSVKVAIEAQLKKLSVEPEAK